jgi:hypothetical protein
MPALTRRRYLERHDCWHVYYGDVHVGTIARRAGVPVDVDQWGWNCGFYPPSHQGRHVGPFRAAARALPASGQVHSRHWRGRPRHEVGMPPHHGRERQDRNNYDCEAATHP